MEAVYYVLKRGSVAIKVDRGGLSSASQLSRPVNKAVSAGSLWQQTYESPALISQSDALYEPISARNSSTAVTLRSCEADDLQMKCWPHEIHRLNGDAERQLLAAVDTVERLRLVETDTGVGQLRDGCQMLAAWNDEGTDKSASELTVLVGGLTGNADGRIRYIGRISGRNGVWFGVELSSVSTTETSLNSSRYRTLNKMLYQMGQNNSWPVSPKLSVGTVLPVINLMTDSELGSSVSYLSLIVTIALPRFVSEIFAQMDRMDDTDCYYHWLPHCGGLADVTL